MLLYFNERVFVLQHEKGEVSLRKNEELKLKIIFLILLFLFLEDK